MIRNILLADDDPLFTSLVADQLAEYKDSLALHVVENGIEAVKKLRKLPFSLVLTDLQMPKMDGFTLFDHIRDHFPDIPVVIVTATGKARTESVMREKGAFGYLEKPVEKEVLIQTVIGAFKKETEGGLLHEASLEMFAQLIEMEQKTCTIRIDNRKTGQRGILFFRKGQLCNARLGGFMGKGAAYEIFKWDRLSLSIENSCRQMENTIGEELQTVLFEAMRMKDEVGSDAPAPQGIGAGGGAPERDTRQDVLPVSAVDQVRRKIDQAAGGKAGLCDVREDGSFNDVVEHGRKLGTFFDAGELKACYLDNGSASGRILVPGKSPVVVDLKTDSFRDRFMTVLS